MTHSVPQPSQRPQTQQGRFSPWFPYLVYCCRSNMLRCRSSNCKTSSSSGMSTASASNRTPTAPIGFSGPTSPPHSANPAMLSANAPTSSRSRPGCSFRNRHSLNIVVVQKPGRAPSTVAFSQNSSFDDDLFLISASPRILFVHVSFIFFDSTAVGYNRKHEFRRTSFDADVRDECEVRGPQKGNRRHAVGSSRRLAGRGDLHGSRGGQCMVFCDHVHRQKHPACVWGWTRESRGPEEDPRELADGHVGALRPCRGQC